MLKIEKPIYFGLFHRFMLYQFNGSGFHKAWKEHYQEEIRVNLDRPTIFVQDAENLDDLGLPEIVFQEFLDQIESVEQVIGIVRKRFPEAFPLPENDS